MDEDRNSLFIAVSEVVRHFLKENAAVNTEVRPDMSLVEDLNLDSLTLVDVILDLEDKFKIKIEETEVQEAVTVSDLTDLVLRKQQAAELV